MPEADQVPWNVRHSPVGISGVDSDGRPHPAVSRSRLSETHRRPNEFRELFREKAAASLWIETQCVILKASRRRGSLHIEYSAKHVLRFVNWYIQAGIITEIQIGRSRGALESNEAWTLAASAPWPLLPVSRQGTL